LVALLIRYKWRLEPSKILLRFCFRFRVTRLFVESKIGHGHLPSLAIIVIILFVYMVHTYKINIHAEL